jgi:SAM-dependent methyltransferase
VRPSSHGWVTETHPPAYDSAYFEKGQTTTVYGDYFAERGWRIEKARRQLAAIDRLAARPVRRALDVGSGHGYFRIALAEAGIDHEGADVSNYAADVAKREYGFDTFLGDLHSPPNGWEQGFDLVTLWDVIEHVPDARTFLATAARFLKPGGMLALRTPNLDCPEADILGPHYHSLQRPHLLYFTPRSVQWFARDVGLEPVRVDTVSHLLRGFVGHQTVDEWMAEGRGADLTAYLVKA